MTDLNRQIFEEFEAEFGKVPADALEPLTDDDKAALVELQAELAKLETDDQPFGSNDDAFDEEIKEEYNYQHQYIRTEKNVDVELFAFDGFKSMKNWMRKDKKGDAVFVPVPLFDGNKATRQATGRSPRISSFIMPGKGHRFIGNDEIDAHSLYFKLATLQAETEGLKYLRSIKNEDWFNMTTGSDNQRIYKTYNQIANELQKSSRDGFKYENIHAALQKKINLAQVPDLDTNKLNAFVTFEETREKAPNYKTNGYNTTTLPYRNPAILKPLKQEQREMVEKVLYTFLNEEDAEIFASFYGAALMNVEQRTLSKALVVQGVSGIGKSTLIESISTGVLGEFAKKENSLDKPFNADDRFATGTISNTRLTFYDEALWHGPRFENYHHDLRGLNTSDLNTLITDGYISSDVKYQQNKFERTITALQVVGTNYVPDVPTGHPMDRRLVLIQVKTTPADEKIAQLNLDAIDKRSLYKFVKENAETFARYFVETYNNNPLLIASLGSLNERLNINPLPATLMLLIDDAEDEDAVDYNNFKNVLKTALTGQTSAKAFVRDTKRGKELVINTAKDQTREHGKTFKNLINKLKTEYGGTSVVKISGAVARCVIVPLEVHN